MAVRTLSAFLAAALLTLALGAGSERPQVAHASPGGITTFAGGGVGDDGPPVQAAVSPAGLAADSAGNVYITDSANCRVRRLTPGGDVSTVAGSGVCGFAGDGGPAVAARLAHPSDVAVTASGEILIADTGNCRVRRVTVSGVMQTLAGSGLCIYGGDGGPAVDAQLAEPGGVAVSAAGDVYIADSGNCRVRRVSGGVISTLAGIGSCGYYGDNGPAALAHISHVADVHEDGAGNVYLADTDVCRVRVVTPGGTIATVAGNGTCGYGGDGGASYAASLNRPRAVTTDAAGDVLIADTAGCRVRKVDYPATTITTVVGDGVCASSGDGGPPAAGRVDDPAGVVLAGGALWVADGGGCRVRRVTAVIETSVGTGWCRYGGDGGTATDAALLNPGESAIDAIGNVYVADAGNCRVRRVAPSGVITTFAGTGACGYGGDGGAAASAALNAPRSVAVDASGALYIADSGNCRIRRVAGGVITTFAGTGVCGYGGDGGAPNAAALTYPQGVAAYGGAVYIADTFACRIRRVSGGVITTVAGNGGCSFGGDGGSPTAASLAFPYSVAVHAQGVYIADTYNCRVRKVAGGAITTLAGSGVCGFAGEGGPATAARVNRPTGVAVDPGGAVYVADTENCRVRLVSGGTIVAAAGYGTGVAGYGCDFAGDGGAATAAVDRPGGVALDAAGAVYVSDTGNGRVRRVAPGWDGDGDGIADTADNCAAAANASQSNADGNLIDLAPPFTFDDLTRARSDGEGDACDADDDNDGLADAADVAGCNGSGPLSATNADSDGDRALDGVECVLGSNPGSAASRPAHIVGPDADSDGVPDAQDPNDASSDSDGDGLSDRLEFRHYETSLVSSNSDGDGCGDAREAASLNADLGVNIADVGLVSSRAGTAGSPQYLVAFDATKDGSINIADVAFVVSQIGPCA